MCCIVENPQHSDFIKLRRMLIQTHMQDLKDTTQDVHYENYRAQCISQISHQALRGKKRESISSNDTVSETDRLLIQKDEEVCGYLLGFVFNSNSISDSNAFYNNRKTEQSATALIELNWFYFIYRFVECKISSFKCRKNSKQMQYWRWTRKTIVLLMFSVFFYFYFILDFCFVLLVPFRFVFIRSICSTSSSYMYLCAECIAWYAQENDNDDDFRGKSAFQPTNNSPHRTNAINTSVWQWQFKSHKQHFPFSLSAFVRCISRECVAAT